MWLSRAIDHIKNNIEDATKSLPEDVFLFVTELTPMVNVDLLIKDEKGRILLAWRNDEISGKGWHIPGGIIRFKEQIEDRIKQVALNEIGTIVKYNPIPISINQFIVPNQKTRAHFISMLYECELSNDYKLPNYDLHKENIGFLKWHATYPNNFLEVQSIYKQYFIEME